ncbi:MAG: aspartate/glutamate racemase family protein, partial [Gemmobacter sp.]|nr:aspartate/glutamate racemase family protein [Gemmobacter sp.]
TRGVRFMTTLYAQKGLLGVLTPQANTTVEPELSLLLPPGFGMIAARLTSPCADMNDRLIDYLEDMDSVADQFANAPVSAIGFACTGASYLVGMPRESEMIETMTQARGIPVITAGRAIADALHALSARRIAVVSPYGDGLTATSVNYWSAHGFEVTEVCQVTQNSAAFHPIYAHSADVALDGLRRLEKSLNADAVVLLGTGLPTLPTLDAAPYVTDRAVPVLSSNLCLAWRMVMAATDSPLTAQSLHDWLSGAHWAHKLP